MKPYTYLFKPNLHELVWGGIRLKPMKGMKADIQPIGESWEISGIPSKESIVSNGPEAGRKLTDILKEQREAVLGQRIYEKYGAEMPMLVKVIDASKPLSIQVHPNEYMAQQHCGKHGKSEMWYVMQAEPGATLMAGFSKEITPEEYEQRVKDGSIVDVIAHHEVKSGDVFFIPAGRVHSLCGGVMVCEIQQSSDITYRLFDYNRLGIDGKPRQLHTAEAREALDFHVYPSYRTDYTLPTEGAVCVTDCPYFTVNLLVTSSTLHRSLLDKDSFVTLTCLEGDCRITMRNGDNLQLKVGQSCLIPAVEADFTIDTDSTVKLLESWAK